MRARTIRGPVGATAAAALITGLAACSGPTGGTASAGPDSAVVGIANEPETLSPLLGYGKDGNSKIFDGLLAHDADMKLKPPWPRPCRRSPRTGSRTPTGCARA